MNIEKTQSYIVTDYTINRVDGMLLGVGDTEEIAIMEFLKAAKKAKESSEKNIAIIDRMIEETERLLQK